MSDDLELFINEDGSLQTIYSDDVAELFDGELGVSTRRASHVEPFGFGWIADMHPVGGPVLFDIATDNPLGRVAFKTRKAALDAEIAWLREQMEQRKLEPR